MSPIALTSGKASEDGTQCDQRGEPRCVILAEGEEFSDAGQRRRGVSTGEAERHGTQVGSPRCHVKPLPSPGGGAFMARKLDGFSLGDRGHCVEK